MTHIIEDKEFAIPMRDGTMTYADVYRPATGRHPVLLIRQPYSRRLGLILATAFSDADPYRVARRGYAVVIQDSRGAPGSGGELRPFLQEIDDGYDTVEACAAQPWSDGNVGMLGRSYIGFTPWLAALAQPPSLKAIAPGITSSGTYGWAYQDGAFQLGFALTWAASWIKDLTYVDKAEHASSGTTDQYEKFARLLSNVTQALNTLPLKDMDGLRIGSPPVPYYEWLDHPSYDDYWRQTDMRHRYRRVLAPSFSMGGWYDLFLQGTIENFQGVVACGGSPAAQASWLLIGPWSHDNPYRHYLGELDFGVEADPIAFGLDDLQLRFFDYWLKGIDDQVTARPPVQIFVMGENRWRYEDQWPPAGVTERRLFLRSGGKANTLHGDGVLGVEPPGGSEPLDSFVYNPDDPVPTWGGPSRVHGVAPKGPIDQRRIEQREDVLVYATPPLMEDLEVTGPVEVELWAISSTVDTDFTAKLIDIYPDGRRLSISDGICRGRYRSSLETAHLLSPGQPALFRIRLGSTSNLFRSGHSVGLEISSSNFPRFDRNLNTAEPFGTGSAARHAQQSVLHSAEFRSALVLPVMPRIASRD